MRNVDWMISHLIHVRAQQKNIVETSMTVYVYHHITTLKVVSTNSFHISFIRTHLSMTENVKKVVDVWDYLKKGNIQLHIEMMHVYKGWDDARYSIIHLIYLFIFYEYFNMNMFDTKTKLLYYYVSILLILSFLNQVNGRIIDTGGKLQYLLLTTWIYSRWNDDVELFCTAQV